MFLFCSFSLREVGVCSEFTYGFSVEGVWWLFRFMVVLRGVTLVGCFFLKGGNFGGRN